MKMLCVNGRYGGPLVTNQVYEVRPYSDAYYSVLIKGIWYDAYLKSRFAEIPTPISLFGGNERYNELGSSFDMEIANALRPIFKRAKEQRVSLRDLHYVALGAVNDVGLSHLIGWE